MEKMKKVLLLGDSVRQGYQEYVKYSLRDVADVYYPNDNGRFCQMTLRYFHDWTRVLTDGHRFKWDIIHFNSGLWDVLRISSEDDCFNSIKQYEELLKRIIQRIRFYYPDVRLIFALTTRVIEPGFPNEDAIRRNVDIEHYNEVALRVCKEYDVIINDLYSITSICSEECYSDNVHFNTKRGEKLLGDAVVKSILNTI